LELNLPLQHAGAGGGGFGLGHVAGSLQADGECCVSQGIEWGEGSERQGGTDGLVELTGIAQGANEAVVGLNMILIDGDGGAKELCGISSIAGGEQVKATLAERFGGGCFGLGHG